MPTTVRGSSPLSRGIRLFCSLFGAAHGIIPALAGNTSHRQPVCQCNTDHPRSRGEYEPPTDLRADMYGSSPLSRGIHVATVVDFQAEGIIPALAGNTRVCSRVARKWWDHPRSRGEYRGWRHTPCTPAGSSPLSRGIRAHGTGRT